MGKLFFVYNWHLKAGCEDEKKDAESIQIRIEEANIIHEILPNVVGNNFYDFIILMGDFNDFDYSFPNAYQPCIRTNVLSTIKNSLNIFFNTNELIEDVSNRVSMIHNVLIDHILVNESAKECIVGCQIYKQEGFVLRASDHWPVVMDFAFSI